MSIISNLLNQVINGLYTIVGDWGIAIILTTILIRLCLLPLSWKQKKSITVQQELSKNMQAARTLFLNKTCFNGLYRVNNSGEFNSPFGKYKNPNIVNEPTLRAVSHYLNTNDIQIQNTDYEDVLQQADKNSFVYLDPPYYPVSQSSNFTGYVQGGWNVADHTRLREVCDKLDKKGVKFLQSNSSADFIKEKYEQYNIHTIKANRSINSDGEKRGEVEEVLIRNYE